MDDKKNKFMTIKIGTVGKSVNGFVFPKDVMEKELNRLFASGSRGVFGTIKTPETGRIRLKDVSHVVRDVWIDGHLIMGKVQIFDTDEGRRFMDMLRREKGNIELCPLGYGSIYKDRNGVSVVQDDYQLEAFVVKAS
jgi:hypothetical protein